MRKRTPKAASHLPPEEIALFRDAIKGVAPLSPSTKVVHPKKPPVPNAQAMLSGNAPNISDTLSDHIPHHVALALDATSYARSGISRQVLCQLRRGHWPIEDELDLHGLTSELARAALVAFLNACGEQGMRCVRIIHGKGHSSKNNEPVLKIKARNWLMQRTEVLAFCEARPEEGGSGAVKVLLKVL